MSIIGWNCRGIGHPRTVPGLKYLVRVYKPDVLFLSETISISSRMEELRCMLGFDSFISVDREGRGGGLALMWRSSFHCSVITYSSNHVDVEVEDNMNGNWRFTGFYGFPGSGRRRDSWNFLRQLSQSSNLPWCILGDFNDILLPSEKKGRNDRAPWLINGFRSAVLDSGLVDIHMEGYPFTWFKSLGTFRAVEERLDRALANDAWFQKFPTAILENLPAPASDHYPILLVREPENRISRIRSRFKFENAWLVDPDFSDFVSNRWLSYGDHQVLKKLDMCASDLTIWNKNHFQRLRRDIDTCRKKIEQLRSKVNSENVNYFNSLRQRMSQLLVQEDAYWRQRAKTHWLRDGDLNTKFFHAAATSRRKVNRINSLLDSSGNLITNNSDLCEVARDYFVDIFTKQHSTIEPVVNINDESILSEDNTLLTEPFTLEEFREAMFSMHPDKCPGPDGFNPGFYQHFWHICGQDIFNECCMWLTTGVFPSTLNLTNIALIPKGDSQQSMKDWRPISLCNVIYKLVAKVLANRLKSILSKCISNNQSAFVPDRSILDNAMVAIEVVHYMKTKTKGKIGDVALKLDISKAYDRIEWDYLRGVMQKMGFCTQWIKWIMMCVESVDYSVLVNNNVAGPITPSRGLRQGDPLSPYLFIICAKGLSALIRKAEARGDIHGIKICRNAPIISHLLFADDCFLFFRASSNEAEAMKNILETYEAASGQAINFQKSEIFCSRNVLGGVRDSIANCLGVHAVLGTGARNKGIHWMSWDKLSMHKNDGGMGFKNLTAFNLALLGKQGWRIMSNPDILISKLYKAKYFPGCEFFESKVGHNPSFVWRSICNSKFLLRAGSRWTIGSGNNIPLLNENWLFDASSLQLQQTEVSLAGHLAVADVILPDTKGWNLPLLTTLLESSGIDKVLHTPLFDSVVEDKRIWRMEKNGVYSVRSAYRLCVQELLDTSHFKMDDTWNLIWKLKAPPRVKNLLWRICRRCVPTRVNLRSRGVNCITVCSLCNDHDEDSRHVFFDCPSSRNVWSMCSFGNKIIAALHNNYAASNLIFDLLQQLSNEDASLMACVIWSIWKQRNNRIWKNVIDAQNFVFSRAAALINEWCAVQQARPDILDGPKS
ncbi:unnamed protein product [Trifolium pratense]|uniref:Uncharacterized protein n=1 Tax=Trifolium pratense TaxID=57577 RepID=A0ACB0I7I6_TRIPR|nr:unnamed protein product [Trifolium pratense]